MSRAGIICSRLKRIKKISLKLSRRCSLNSFFPPQPTARTHALSREKNRGRHEIRVLDCQEVTPQRVGFPGVQTIARLRRRVRRNGKKTTEIIYLISSLTLEELDAAGFLKLKRGYWVIESRLHHALDVSLDEDRSRVRNGNAALVLGRSEEHTSELQSLAYLVCRLLLEKKKRRL